MFKSLLGARRSIERRSECHSRVGASRQARMDRDAVLAAGLFPSQRLPKETMSTLRKLLTLCVSVLSTGSILQSCSVGQLSVQQVRQEIHQAVPNGTIPTRVLGALDSLKIEHGPYEESTKTIAAIIRNAGRNGMIRRSIRIEFVFDSSGQLYADSVQEILTGP